MTAADAPAHPHDPYRMGKGHGGHGHGHGHAGPKNEGGPPSKRIIVGYGFWIFLLSDIVMFSGFFAAYAVLSGRTAGGPTGRELFDITNVAIETAFLLASSFTCGLASLAAAARYKLKFSTAQASSGWSCTSSSAWRPRAQGRSGAPSCRPSSL
jgi:cytochrome o ubiquinol oxidase subunit 3